MNDDGQICHGKIMKVQSFLIALATSLLLVVAVVILPGAGLANTDPINVENAKFNLPNTAKFFPKEAALTFHWAIDSEKKANHFESITNSGTSKDSLKPFKDLRNGLFALAGLDFENELSEWLDSELSFALFKLNEAEKNYSWVITITSSKENIATKFLERFWLKASLEGEDVRINNYRGISWIKSDSSNSTNKNNLATALINNNLILIASNEKALKNSLAISQFDYQNQSGDKYLKDTIKKLSNGSALITLSPNALNSFLELPKEITEEETFGGFIALLKQTQNSLILDGVFKFEEPLQEAKKRTKELDLSLLNASKGPAEGLGILYSPHELINEVNKSPFNELIARLISKELEKSKGIALKEVARLSEETLLLIKAPTGLVLGSTNTSPSIAKIGENLQQDDQSKSSLSIDNQEFKVWSKLITTKVNDYANIETEFGVILSKESDNNWWGENLAALQQRQQEQGLQLREKQLEELNANYKNHPSLQLALNSKYAKEVFSNWTPWQILNSIAGGSLKNVIKGLAFSLDPDWGQSDSSINLRASIQITS